MLLIFSVQPPKHFNKILYESLQYIMQVCREHQQQRADLNSAKIRQQQRRRTISKEETEEETIEEGIMYILLGENLKNIWRSRLQKHCGKKMN